MPDRTKYALTDPQKDELRRLLAAGCVDRDTAMSIYDLPLKRANPNVIGILIEKGFALKRVKTRNLSSRTCYWLTAAGVAQAQELAL